MAKSFGQHFQNAYADDGITKGYVRAHYDVTGFCQDGEALNGSYMGRIRNAVIEGINKQTLMPKAIIMVLDMDFLDHINHYNPGISFICGKMLEWVSNQLHRAVTAHKEKLPSKSRKFRYPMFLWIRMPMHKRVWQIERI